MHHTICQKCGAANQSTAVVCTECGTRLSHPENRLFARMIRSELFRSITSMPGRLLRWTFRKIKLVIVTTVFCTIVLAGLLFFFLFAPLSWGNYPLHPMPSEKDINFQSQAQKLRRSGGILAGDPQRLSQLGNLMIFNPGYGSYHISDRNKSGAKLSPDPVNGYFAFRKSSNDLVEMVFFQKLYGKLPFRLLAAFEVKRSRNGQLALLHCRVGNLPVPLWLLRKVAAYTLQKQNPDQQFLQAVERISKASMELRADGKEKEITLEIRPADSKR